MARMFPDDPVPDDDDEEDESLPIGRRMPWPEDYFGVQPHHVFGRIRGVESTGIVRNEHAQNGAE